MNSGTLTVIAGIAIFFNFAIILWKFKAERYLDMLLDAGTLIAISYLTMGSVSGFQAGMIGSMLMSLYLLIANPMKSYTVFDAKDTEQEEIDYA